MLHTVVVRYLAIVLGTVLWDAGAVLQKQAVGRMPAGGLPVRALVGSAGWMLGLFVTAAGWGLFVFGLDQVPISAARTITAGSYVVLALFSIAFLHAPLSLAEWLALACVTLGIVFLGLQENTASPLVVPSALSVILAAAGFVLLSAVVLFSLQFFGWMRTTAVAALFAFSALSGLLSSVGDLLTKVFLALIEEAPIRHVPSLILDAAGFITFYLTGFYMLSRAYQAGSVVGAVVVSDFFGRVGALLLGLLVLSEPIGGPGHGGLQRALGFLLVLGGSLFLGRFSAGASARGSGSE